MSNQINWLDVSQQYLNSGFSVIPVSGKMPIIKDWQRFNYDLPDEVITKNGQTGIGLCVGPASGIAAIDIDTDDKSILDLVPYSPVVRRGKKGEVRFYQYAKGVDSRKFHPYGIEIFNNSGQVVLPPSIHPDTKQPYAWASDATLLSIKKEYLPELDLSFLSKLNELKTISFEQKGRNNRLKDIVVSCLTRYESFEYATKEVYYNDKEYSKPRLFLDNGEGFKGKGEDDALRNAAVFTSRVQTSLLSKNIISPILEISEDEEEELTEEEIDIKSLSPFNNGILGCIYKSLQLSLDVNSGNSIAGATLAIMSGIIGNRYVLKDGSAYDTTANDYFCFVKPSGAGKSLLLNQIETFIKECEPKYEKAYFYGPQESGSSFSQSIESNSVNIFNFDEISTVLKIINTGRGDLEQNITRCWEISRRKIALSSSMAKKKEKAKEYLENAFVNIIGATTNSQFTEHSKREMLNSGFYNRFLFFVDQKTTRDMINLKMEIPEWAMLRKITEPLTQACGVVVATDEKYKSALDEVTIEERLAVRNSELRSRRISHAQKIALMFAISENPRKPIVTAKNLTEAIAFVDTCYDNLDAMFSEINSSNDYERDWKRTIDVLSKCRLPLSSGRLRDRVLPKSGFAYGPMLDRMCKEGIIVACKNKRGSMSFKLN